MQHGSSGSLTGYVHRIWVLFPSDLVSYVYCFLVFLILLLSSSIFLSFIFSFFFCSFVSFFIVESFSTCRLFFLGASDGRPQTVVQAGFLKWLLYTVGSVCPMHSPSRVGLIGRMWVIFDHSTIAGKLTAPTWFGEKIDRGNTKHPASWKLT